MYTIKINEEHETISDMAEALRYIADMIEKGYTLGVYWELIKSEN